VSTGCNEIHASDLDVHARDSRHRYDLMVSFAIPLLPSRQDFVEFRSP
jgi:hypothetical protein